MTITLRAVGTSSGPTDAVTAVTVGVTSLATSTDLSLLSVVAKPYTATINTPAGWTKIAEATNSTVASAVDTGSTKVALFAAVGVAPSTVVPVTQSGANVLGAGVVTYATDKGSWDISSFGAGGQAADAANYSATSTTAMAIAAGDRLYEATGLNNHVGTVTASSFGGLSGATQVTLVGRIDQAFTTGDAARLYVRDVGISAGASNGAPRWTMTNATVSAGTTIFFRLRDLIGDGPSLVVATDITPVGSVGRPGVGATRASTFSVSATGITTGNNPGSQAALTGFEVFSPLAASAPQGVLTGFEVFSAGAVSSSQGVLTGFEVFGQNSTLAAVLSGPTALEPALTFSLSLTGSPGSPDGGSIIQVSGPDARLIGSGMTATGRAPIVLPTPDDSPIILIFQGTVTKGAAQSTALWSIELYPHTLWRRQGDALVPVLWWSGGVPDPTDPTPPGNPPLYPDSGVFPDSGRYPRS